MPKPKSKQPKVVITRPAKQVQPFFELCLKHDLTPILLPIIQVGALPVEAPDLNQYDWLVFTSRNAVHYFLPLLEAHQRNLIEEKRIKIAVVGHKTARFAEEHELSVDFIPTQHTAKGLAEELPTKEGQCILQPCSKIARKDFQSILEAKSVEVERCALYNTTPINYTQTDWENLKKQQPTVITFTSPSAVRSFVNQSCQCEMDWEQTIFASIGPSTTKALEKEGYTNIIEAEKHNVEGLIQAITTHLNG